MTSKPEVLILADDRPTSVCDDLYQWSIDAENALRSLHTENEDLRDTVQFVERWVVHHGTKGCMSAAETLSAIQHYPGIAEVTDGYADGKRPATFNPYARIQELEAAVAQAEEPQQAVPLSESRNQRVYVAGPMTGMPDYNFPAFNAAASMLRAKGWHVENPAEHGIVAGATWADYMHYDLARIATCSAIYLLPGWCLSRGAALEVHIASCLGMTFQYADGAERYQPPSAANPTQQGCV